MKMTPGESWKEEEETASVGIMFPPATDADDGQCNPLQLSKAVGLKTQRSMARVSTVL